MSNCHQLKNNNTACRDHRMPTMLRMLSVLLALTLKLKRIFDITTKSRALMKHIYASLIVEQFSVSFYKLKLSNFLCIITKDCTHLIIYLTILLTISILSDTSRPRYSILSMEVLLSAHVYLCINNAQ